MRINRINFLDLYFDQLNFEGVEDLLRSATTETPYAYIVTPNVDHVVRVHREPALRELYNAADLVVCDSRVLMLLARLRGIRLPLVPGSDLSAALFSDVIQAGDRIAIVGTDRMCLEQLRAKFPRVDLIHFEAPMDLRGNAKARRSAAAFVAASKARFAFIAVGSPQQEMIAREVREITGATGIGLCVGAGLDFVVGKQRRAPKLLRAIGLEWAHRLATNPRRLWRRYLVEGVRIFPIWLRWRSSARTVLLILAVLAGTGILAAAGLYLRLRLDNRDLASQTVELPPPAHQSIAAIKALPPPNLLKPLSPSEASKENAERPFVARPDTAASRFMLRADADNLSRALTCLAQAVYYEAAGEGTDGGRAVAQVVLNRVRHPGFPSTICGVVYQGAERPTGCQFSFTCDGSMQRVPEPWLWTRSRQIAEQALKGKVFAPVGHATHYHADYVLPFWADSLDKSVQIGRHIFYRLRNALGDARAFSQHYGGTEPPFREPGTTVVIPLTPEGQKLTNALISDGDQAPPKSADPPSHKPDIPLTIDSTAASTLLADGQAPPQQPHRTKPSKECNAPDRRQLVPLGATDMRAGESASSC